VLGAFGSYGLPPPPLGHGCVVHALPLHRTLCFSHCSTHLASRSFLLCGDQSQFIVNPKPFLADLVGKQVLVKLKWGHMEYQGTLNSSDSYMNLYLERTEELIDGQFAGFLGDVLIRCNNILYLKAAPIDE
jgi:small nuclear ribonucleoprotein F